MSHKRWHLEVYHIHYFISTCPRSADTKRFIIYTTSPHFNLSHKRWHQGVYHIHYFTSLQHVPHALTPRCLLYTLLHFNMWHNRWHQDVYHIHYFTSTCPTLALTKGFIIYDTSLQHVPQALTARGLSYTLRHLTSTCPTNADFKRFIIYATSLHFNISVGMLFKYIHRQYRLSYFQNYWAIAQFYFKMGMFSKPHPYTDQLSSTWHFLHFPNLNAIQRNLLYHNLTCWINIYNS